MNDVNGKKKVVKEIVRLDDDDKESYDVIKYNKSKDDALKEIKKDDGFIIIFTDDVDNTISATLISNGYIDTIDYQIISSAINNTKVTLAINASNISPDELNKIYSAVDIKREILDEIPRFPSGRPRCSP